MNQVELRQLKDHAAKAVEKRHYDQAAELYLQIAELEPDQPDWRQRAGEALRKTDDNNQAAAQLKLAAEGYAKGGFLLKAIAVCKVVLQIDSAHTATQRLLADLYAQRDVHDELRPTPSGNFEVSLPEFPAPALPLLSVEPDSELSLQLAALDEIDRAFPSGAPMDVVPLASVLGGQKSGQFQLVPPEEAEGTDINPNSAAYEITLDDLEEVTEPAPRPALARLDDELDFSGLVEATAPPKKPPPIPEAALPRIPLLSSLAPDRLRHVIERVDVRQFEAGQIIVREGDRGGSLFVIVSGRVQVQVGERELATLRDGDFFGEQAILTDFPRTATVTAGESTQLLEFSRSLLSELVANSPDVLRTLLRFFRDRLLDRLLGSSPLFATLNPKDARTLSERFLFLELEPKLRVVREGERAPGLFFLLAGEAQVLRGQAKLATLGPGDVFGEMSLLAGGGAIASIVTVSKCWALELPRKDFQEIMVSYPQVLAYVSELAETRSAHNDRVELL